MSLRPLIPTHVSAIASARTRVPWTFGPATVRLLLIGLLLLIPAWFDPRLLGVLGVWDVVVLAAWAIDLRRLPPPGTLTVTRSWSAPPALGVPQPITLEVENRSDVGLHVWLMDVIDPTLRPALEERDLIVPAGGSERVQYRVMPRARGDLALAGVALRYRGASGLSERWADAPLQQTVRIYPDFAEARRQRLALIRARQIVMQKRRSRAYGIGREFDRLRDFQDGDELRDVCWTATARRGKLVTRTYRPERSQTVWIVLDAGRLMRAREGVYTRLDRAANAAFALAEVAMDAGDRVALLVYGRGTSRRLPPSRGPVQLRAMLDLLATTAAQPAEADHARAAAALRAYQTRRALVVWLTDVGESADVPEVVDSAAALVPAHVVVLAVTRPVQLAALAASVPEQARDLYRIMAAQEMAERRAGLLGRLRQRGVQAVEVPSADMTTAVIDRYLGVKERGAL